LGKWESIKFEIEYKEDLPGSLVDYEYEIDGVYEYNGNHTREGFNSIH